MEPMLLLAPLGAISALLFAVVLAMRVKRLERGNALMIKISDAVAKGANSFLKIQYRGIGIYFAAMFVLLLILARIGFVRTFVPFGFLTGGFFSGLSGFIGMKIATAANARTANAAMNSLNRGLRTAFSAGAVMGFTVVGLGLLDLSVWFYFL